MIETKNLSKTYYSKKGVAVNALKNVSISFADKGLVFLLGKSGCGKSTLLNLIGGLDGYDVGGEILIDGKSSAQFSAKEYDEYRNRYVGFVFQEFNLLEDMNVTENVCFALELQGVRNGKEMATKALLEVGLPEDIFPRRVTELSGGQKQRVAIARALVKKPKLILADEPTGDLDSETGNQIFALLKEVSKTVLVIIVTHDRENALKYGGRVVAMIDGSITEDSAM